VPISSGVLSSQVDQKLRLVCPHLLQHFHRLRGVSLDRGEVIFGLHAGRLLDGGEPLLGFLDVCGEVIQGTLAEPAEKPYERGDDGVRGVMEEIDHL
jgi:hypothetical protein